MAGANERARVGGSGYVHHPGAHYRAGDADEMKLMLQSLLPERFHLKIHWENPRMTVYFLQVAGHGVKLAAATDMAHCGEVFFRDGVMKAACMDTDGIAEILQNSVLNQPVLNRTGLGGDKKYKVDLEFAGSDDAEGRESAD